MDIGDRVEVVEPKRNGFIGRRGIIASINDRVFGVLLYKTGTEDRDELEEIEVQFSGRELAPLESVFWIEY